MAIPVIVSGYLGQDIEVKTAKNGVPYVSAGIAIRDGWRDANGDRKDIWCNFTTFGKENCERLQKVKMDKGSAVVFSGPAMVQMKTDRDGNLVPALLLQDAVFVQYQDSAAKKDGQGGKVKAGKPQAENTEWDSEADDIPF